MTEDLLDLLEQLDLEEEPRTDRLHDLSAWSPTVHPDFDLVEINSIKGDLPCT